MNNVAKIILASAGTICPLIASAHPGHDGSDPIWDFRSHNIYDSPVFLFLVAMAASALVFRFAFRHK